MKRIGLIAGGGQFPIIFSKAASARGYAVYAAAYVREADAQLTDHVRAVEWLHLGQVNRLLKFFRKHRVPEAVMMGAITKTKMFTDVRPDLKAISMMAGLRHTHDDGILSAFADLLEKEGVRIRPSTFLLPDMVAGEGCWTKRKPTRSELADIDIGWGMAKAIGRLDIGQCVVVKGGSVLAVEAIDGTDATLKRGGRLGNGGAVAVKVCKPIQDTRFDMPAVGVTTVMNMIDAKISALAIEAGKAVVFEKQEMITAADRNKIAIVALSR
jgi:DUF1009 family protein